MDNQNEGDPMAMELDPSSAEPGMEMVASNELNEEDETNKNSDSFMPEVLEESLSVANTDTRDNGNAQEGIDGMDNDIEKEVVDETLDEEDQNGNGSVDAEDQESVIFEEEFEDLRDNELSASESEEDVTFGSRGMEDEAEGNLTGDGVDEGEGDAQHDEEEEDEEHQLQHETDEEHDGDENQKILHLPMSKVKKLMKTDSSTSVIAKDAVAAMIISTELFISFLAQQSCRVATSTKKKTVQLGHVKTALPTSPLFDFLEGTLPDHDI